MFCFCFLAYGDEHINEFNIVAKSILDLDKDFKIIVGTDSPSKIIEGVYRVIKLSESFNYNLKRIVIGEALTEFDTLFFLDTDTFIKSDADFFILNHIDEGFHASKIVGLDELRDVYGSLEYMKDYLSILTTVTDDALELIHEGKFVLHIKDNDKKRSFIQWWEKIDRQTRPYQKLAYDLPGAMEGIIIWIAVKKSMIDLKIVDSELKTFFKSIKHFGKANIKLKKSLI